MTQNRLSDVDNEWMDRKYDGELRDWSKESFKPVIWISHFIASKNLYAQKRENLKCCSVTEICHSEGGMSQ